MIKPVADRVIILPDEVSSKTESGVIIPDDAKGKPTYGLVVGVGNLCIYCKPQDRVIYPPGYGSKLTIDGVEHLIMRETDMFCVIETSKDLTIEDIT